MGRRVHSHDTERPHYADEQREPEMARDGYVVLDRARVRPRDDSYGDAMPAPYGYGGGSRGDRRGLSDRDWDDNG